MEVKFKTGDWCFCEFTLSQITECAEDGRIRSVTDGFFNLSGHDLTDRCFPLALDVKRISDDVDYWSKKLLNLNQVNLNHPDLNRELIHRWAEMCEKRGNTEELKVLSQRLNDFGSSVVRYISDLRNDEVDGVRLFKR